jgi:hypothetical protein
MDFDSGWLFKANDQKAVMSFLPVFGKPLVRGDQHALFMHGFLPKLSELGSDQAEHQNFNLLDQKTACF